MGVIWEWNGSDLAQFEGTAAFATAGWTPTLALVADSGVAGGFYLQLDAVGTGAGAAVFLVSDVIDISTYRHLVWEAEVIQSTAQFAGISFLGDDSGPSPYLYAITQGETQQRLFRVDAGTFEATATTKGSVFENGVPGMLRMHLSFDKADATEPRFTAYSEGPGVSTSDMRQQDASQTDYDSRPVPAGWASTTPNRWGIAIERVAGQSAGAWQIHRLRLIDPLGSSTPTPPTVTLVSPPEGEIARDSELTIDVTDVDGFSAICVQAEFEPLGAGEYDVVHDGNKFSARYAAGSTRTAIENGFRYVINRNTGWPSTGMYFRALAIDALGAPDS